MPLIIDAYNVLHTTGVLPPEIAGIDVRGLIELLRSGRFRHERTTIVCDGLPAEDAPTGREGPVVIRYSGGDCTADDVIAKMIRKSSIPKKLTVVSSDRAVLREARKRRCSTVPSEDFLRRLAEDHEQAGSRQRRRTGRATPPTPLPGEEVEQWLEEFELGDAEFLPPPVSPGEAEAPPQQETPEPEPRSAPAAPPPSPPVFSAEMLAEAEAILEAGLPEEPAPPPPDQEPQPPAEPMEREADRDGPDAREDDEVTSPPTAALGAILPGSVLAEAEAIVAERLAEDAEASRSAEPQAPDRPDASTAGEHEAESPERARKGAMRAVLPDDLVAQAEALEQAAQTPARADRSPGAATADRDDPGSAELEHPPPPTEDILPPGILAEAEALLREGEDADGEVAEADPSDAEEEERPAD